MSRRILIILNPFSGKKKAEKVCQQLTDLLSKRDLKHVVFRTAAENNSELIRSESVSGYTDVIVLGGDGTLNHAVNGVRDSKVVMSLIPCGTGNDFAKNIDLGKTLSEQIETAIDGKPTPIDAGLCNDRIFLNGVGMGFDGQIVYDMLNKKSILKGHAKYYAQVLRILATYQAQGLSFDFNEKQLRESVLLLVIGNGTTFGGGFKLTPKADVKDGYLDLCTIGDISAVKRFLNIHKLSSGTHDQLKEVRLDQTKSIQIGENSIMKAHIDGEYLGTPPFDIKVLPGYLNFRVRN